MTLPLSVIIPAHNEARRIGATLEAIAGYLGPRCDFEVLVVDDGSVDGTARIVQQAMARHPEIRLLPLPSHRGKGAAVREGLRRAEGALAVFCDADLPVPIEEIEKLLHVLGEDACDVAIASRALPESIVAASPGLVRRALSPAFNRLVRAIFSLPFGDTQCGFKGFRRQAAQAISARARIDGFAFDVELLVLADRLGYRVGEIPVRVENAASSPLRLLAQSGGILLDLWRVWIRLRSGAYRLPPHVPAAPPPSEPAGAPRNG